MEGDSADRDAAVRYIASRWIEAATDNRSGSDGAIVAHLFEMLPDLASSVVRHLVQDERWSVRLVAVAVMGGVAQVSPKDGVELWATLLQDADEDVRLAAADSLRFNIELNQLPPEVVGELQSFLTL